MGISVFWFRKLLQRMQHCAYNISNLRILRSIQGATPEHFQRLEMFPVLYVLPSLFSSLLCSSLISFQSCNKSVSVNVQSNKSKSFDECYLPGSCPPHHCSMTHQPPWKHSATSKCIAWRFIWHVLGRQKFVVGSSGDDCAELNMHSGQDDEDLQKALVFLLIAIRLGGWFQSGEARQSWSVNNPKR